MLTGINGMGSWYPMTRGKESGSGESNQGEGTNKPENTPELPSWDGTNSGGSVSSSGGMLTMTDFYTLLAAQLRYQDADNPMDTSEMMAQMVQSQMIQTITQLSEVTITTYAASMAGKEVTVAEVDSKGQYTGENTVGVVESVVFSGNTPILFVNGKGYYMSQLMAIGKVPDMEGNGEIEKPGEGEGTEKPGEGEGTQKPGEGEGTQKPGEGEGIQKPGEGEGTQKPGEGEGTEKPGEGEGTQKPGEGEGTQKPEGDGNVTNPDKPEGDGKGEGEGTQKPGEGEGTQKPEGDGNVTNPDKPEGDGNVTNPDKPEGDGNVTNPDKPEGDGNVTNPDKPEGDGNTTSPDPEGDGNVTNPDKPEGDGNVTNPDKPEGDGNTTSPDKPEGEGNTGNPEQPEENGEPQTQSMREFLQRRTIIL